MDWLLEGGQSSGDSDDGRPGGSTGKATVGAGEGMKIFQRKPWWSGFRFNASLILISLCSIYDFLT